MTFTNHKVDNINVIMLTSHSMHSPVVYEH